MKFEIAKAVASARAHHLCEGCRAFTALDPHHRMTRGIGGVHRIASDVSNDPRNLIMLCRGCHDRTLTDAAACIKIGWVIERRAGVDPRDVPAKIHTVNGYGWWYLTEEGSYEWADHLNLDPNFILEYQEFPVQVEAGQVYTATYGPTGVKIENVTPDDSSLKEGTE
jgi:hypothetical protein